MKLSKAVCAIALSLAASIAYSAPASPDLNKLCSALTSLGVSSGTWRKSNSTPGGWVCSNMGASIQFGPVGPLGMSSNVSYFVVGSGQSKLDNAQLKLNVNNVSSFTEGKGKLVQATKLALAIFGEKLPVGFEASLSKVKPKINESFTGKVAAVELFKSEFPGHTFVVTQASGRLTSVLATIRSNASSKLWE